MNFSRVPATFGAADHSWEGYFYDVFGRLKGKLVDVRKRKPMLLSFPPLYQKSLPFYNNFVLLQLNPDLSSAFDTQGIKIFLGQLQAACSVQYRQLFMGGILRIAVLVFAERIKGRYIFKGMLSYHFRSGFSVSYGNHSVYGSG